MFDEQSILIVEDEPITALCLSNAVQEMNGRVIGPVATVREALVLVATVSVAAAVLDANLADRDVTPLAMRLAEKGVPFIIHTGSGVPPALAEVHPNLTVLMKPQSPKTVLARLRDEMEKGRPA